MYHNELLNWFVIQIGKTLKGKHVKIMGGTIIAEGMVKKAMGGMKAMVISSIG